MAIRVILVDDHAVVRDGVGYLLDAQSDIRVVGSFGDGHEAVRFAAAERPDVAIIDIAMQKMNGIEVTRQIHDASPETRILMLTMHASLEYVHQAFQAGAKGYVLKESASSEVAIAVRTVAAGERYLSRKIADGPIERYLKERRTEDPLERLSARERQVLQLTAEGKTSAEASKLLGLSPKTIETYRSRMMRKLELDDLPALVKFAIRHGITSVE